MKLESVSPITLERGNVCVRLGRCGRKRERDGESREGHGERERIGRERKGGKEKEGKRGRERQRERERWKERERARDVEREREKVEWGVRE